MQLLYAFRPAKQSGAYQGITKRVANLFRYFAGQSEEDINKHLPMLRFVARKHPQAWRRLVALHEASGTRTGLIKAKAAVRQCLENSTDSNDLEWASRKLAYLCRKTGDRPGELHALIEMCELPGSSYRTIRQTVQRTFEVFNTHYGRNPKPVLKVEKKMIAQQLIGVMEMRLGEAQPDDLKWLARLYVNTDDFEGAQQITKLGLELDPSDYDLNKLAGEVGLR